MVQFIKCKIYKWIIKYDTPSNFLWTHASSPALQNKMNMLRSVLKEDQSNTRNKNPYVVYHRFKGSDDIFDTNTLNLADISSCLPCVINLLLLIVESGSTLSNKFWLSYSFVKLTTL